METLFDKRGNPNDLQENRLYERVHVLKEIDKVLEGDAIFTEAASTGTAEPCPNLLIRMRRKFFVPLHRYGQSSEQCCQTQADRCRSGTGEHGKAYEIWRGQVIAVEAMRLQ